MTAPTFPTLGAGTVARKWVLQVNTSSTNTASWTTVGGVTNFTPVTDSANWVDDSDYESGGYSSQTKTGAAWSATCTVRRAPQQGVTPAAYDEGQEFLRTHAIGQFGPAAQVNVRFFEFSADTTTPRTEAYMGYAGVSWEDQGGGPLDLSTVNVTLNGQGKLNAITHPFPSA